jgi:very-short-patch-repair endonuclease
MNKVENQIIEYPSLSEEKIEQIIKEKYSNKDEKTKKFIKKALRKHGDRYDYSNVVYVRTKEKVEIICRVEGHKPFLMTPEKHYLRGQGCSYCSGKHKYTTEEFIEESNKIHGIGRYDYSKTKYINGGTKVIIICHNHNKPYEFSQFANVHLQGHGCKKCQYDKLKMLCEMTKEEFIKRAKKIHYNLYDYSQVIYNGYDVNVSILCKKHNKIFKQTPHAHLNGQGCPLCCSSKGEIIVRNYLINNKIEFEEQKRFDDCKDKRKLPFDFYLPQYNLCIEYDGIQHFNPNSFNSKKESEIKKLENFKIIQSHDQIKNEYCNSHSINLLRIRYNENVEEKLNEYFQEHNIKILTDVSFYKNWFDENCKDLIIEQNH